MSEVTRRKFVGMAALAGGLAAAGPTPAAKRSSIAVDFTVDGIPITPAEYAGRPPAEYAALFDTVYVSLWKCFNAAGGAVLAGPKAKLADLYHVRRMFGGALWNAWPYAAVARHYAEGYLERLTAAVRVSEGLVKLLSGDDRFKTELVPAGTSLFRLTPKTADLSAYRDRLAARGITIPPPDAGAFWLKVNETQRGVSPEALADAFRSALA